MSAPLPRLDPYMTSIGEELEDVSRIGAAQPFRSQGPSLPRDDLDVLVRAAKARLRTVAATPALVDAGLMDDNGLTTDGRTVAAMLQAPTGRLRVESGRGRTPLTLDVYLHQGLALALSTVSPAALTDVPHGEDLYTAATTVGLNILDPTAVPAHIASWVGLAPAWSLATSPESIPEDAVLARVDDPTSPPPPGADAHLRYVWEQPWFLWTLSTTDPERGLVMVHAGRAGQFALTQSTTPGAAGFRALVAVEVWLRLVEAAAVATHA